MQRSPAASSLGAPDQAHPTTLSSRPERSAQADRVAEGPAVAFVFALAFASEIGRGFSPDIKVTLTLLFRSVRSRIPRIERGEFLFVSQIRH